ncbi:hypothetical protein [Vitiosangium sp. GDMCC 1.1324]|uniref:nSTAND1 domain-containing NTPase n=1 Tax=Vitiosangium sp. (strain GDMCC 1.1324) TaxID=2138576 RepID=UPI000D3C6DEE|nr:hypothetical protein [Vitiosangium sp. GDMCC 1.1324]PTL82478.1 hypothetical protein DAT35_16830 [Vitiosangium sp. GDMCC 1.1324]
MNDRPHPPPDIPPFKYLDYFQESEHEWFAGREDEIQELLTGVMRGRTYVLYGHAGSGMTSLMLAGLFHPWRQRGFHPLRVRVLESPVAELCAALASELDCPELAREMDPHLLVGLCAREPLLIVLDQFEEFFTRFKERPQEREAFIGFLGRISQESAANVRLIFCISEDSYARLEDLRATLPDLTENGLRLPPLTAYGARQAIVRPLLHVGARYDEAFVNALVDDLAGWQFEPVVLQVACGELYRDAAQRQGLPVRLTREDLERLGGVEGILHRYSHHLTSGLAPEWLMLVRAVLEGLITPEHTRRIARAEDLLAGTTRVELGETQEVLKRLAEVRLLRVVQRPDGTWYELMHERLVGIIEQWLNEDPDFVRFRMTRHLITSWSEDPQWRADPHWLLSGEQLEERVDPWKERLRLNEKETEFILCSVIHAHRDTVCFWASRYDEFGAGHTRELLLKLLEHPHPAMRLGAARACASQEDNTGQLTTRCLRLALEAPDKALRRAAGSSFAKLARPEDIAQLRGAHEEPDLRVHALEVMADLSEARRSLRGFPAWERLLAHRIVRRRRVERNWHVIERRASIGAFTGARMTLVWSFTIGLAILFVLLVTTFPLQVTMGWPWEFARQGLGVGLIFIPFILIPLGMLISWRVARRTGILLALHGHEHWGYPTFRSGTVMFGSALLSCVFLAFMVGPTDAVVGLADKLGVTPWFVLLLMTLATAFLAWLLTWVLVALGSHCIPTKARPPTVYLWAFLGSGCVPLAIETLLSRSALWAKTWDLDFAEVLGLVAGVATIISSFQSFVVICALARARKRLGGEQPSPRRAVIHLSRATLLLGALICGVIAAIFLGTDTIPSRVKSPLGRELPLEGTVWKVRDADYFTLLGPGGDGFAMSVHGENAATRLLMDGLDISDNSLLVSARQQVLAAVTARPLQQVPEKTPAEIPPRIPYHYDLVQEPIQREAPDEVTESNWTLISLPLEPSLSNSGREQELKWQASLAGKLPPDWKTKGTVVHVHPVLLHLPGLEQGKCLDLFGTSNTLLGLTNALVMRNRDDAQTVPPPNSLAELFLEGFRVEPAPGGQWSLQLTVFQSHGIEPVQCLPSRGIFSMMAPRRTTSLESSDEPRWILVAVKLY